MLKFVSVLFTLFLFVSCVGEVPKLSPISLISTSFNPGNYSSFAGGIIIVGEDQSGNKIHKSFPNGIVTPFPLTRGDWKFYAVGYDGVSYVENSVTKIAQMEGTISCGTSEVSVKLGKETTIDLNLTPGGCSGALYRDLKIRTMKVEPCLYFGVHNFNSSVYTPSPAFTLNECSRIPSEQWGVTTYYRFVAQNVINGEYSDGLKSRCAIAFGGDFAHQIPTSVVPIKIQTYRSQTLCERDDYKQNEFVFENGLQHENPSEFDSEYATSSDVLYIPEAHTKRFRSPFMNTIPRLLCKSGLNDADCLQTTFSSTRSYTIEWDKPLKDILLISDPKDNACDTIGTNSRFFQISDCKIKNKLLYATLSRNKLTCQDSATAGTLTYKDIKFRDGKMYMLYVKAGSSYVAVYNEGGQLLIEYNVGPASTNWNALAVGKDDHFWVANAASSAVIRYKPNGPTSFTPENALFGANGIAAESLEVSEDGNYLFVGKQGTNDIFVYELVSGFMQNVDTITLGEDVRKIQFYDGKLYAHGSDSPGVSNGTFYRMAFNAGELSILQSPSAATSKTFHVDKGYFIIVGSGNEALVFPNMVSQGLMTGAYGTGVNAFSGNVNRLQIVNYQLYGFEHGTNTLRTMGWTPASWTSGTWVTGAGSTDACSEPIITIFEDGVSKTFLSLATSKTLPDNIQRNKELYRASAKLVGIREFNYSLITLVKEMTEDQTRLNTGGYLSQAQRLLGPQGVGGMLYDFNDCTSIKTALLGGTIHRSYAVEDPYRGYQSYDIRIQSNEDIIHPFICDDSLVNSSCPNKYELQIDVASTGLFETESYQMKLKCDSKVGQLRYNRVNGNRSAKEQYFWNTNDQDQQRYDAYKLSQDSGYQSREMAMVFKQNNLVKGRSVLFEEWTNYRRVAIDQYERFTNDHAVYHEELAGFTSGVPSGDPSLFSNATYNALRDDNEHSGNSTACMSNTETNLDVALNNCNIAPIGLSNSKNIPLRLDSIENSASFMNYFNTFP